MTHIEIKKISEKNIPAKDMHGYEVFNPHDLDKNGKPKKIMEKVVRVELECISISSIRSICELRRSDDVIDKIPGKKTLIYMHSSVEKKDGEGNNTYSSIIVNEEYNEFVKRCGFITRVNK